MEYCPDKYPQLNLQERKERELEGGRRGTEMSGLWAGVSLEEVSSAWGFSVRSKPKGGEEQTGYTGPGHALIPHGPCQGYTEPGLTHDSCRACQGYPGPGLAHNPHGPCQGYLG